MNPIENNRFCIQHKTTITNEREREKKMRQRKLETNMKNFLKPLNLFIRKLDRHEFESCKWFGFTCDAKLSPAHTHTHQPPQQTDYRIK